MAKYNSHEALKRVRVKMKEMGLSKRRKFMHFKCTVCGVESSVMITNPAIYTEDVIKNWSCYSCSSNKKVKK